MPPDAEQPLTARCARFDQPCPMAGCLGVDEPAACDHWYRLNAWRGVPCRDQAIRAEGATRSALDPRVRDAVNQCPDRGGVLPVSDQDDCGCRGGEWSQCRAGRGKQPGKVTLADCLACRTADLARGTNACDHSGSSPGRDRSSIAGLPMASP